MNGAWIRGSFLERAALRWRRESLERTGALDIFKELRTARKILILPNDRVGGLFIGAPMYKAVRQFYPQAQIALLVDDRKASIARQIPFVDQVVVGDLRKPIWSLSFGELVARLRAEGFDLAFCLGPDCSFRLAQICGRCGARLRIGFGREGIAPFNFEIVRRSSQGYEGEQYMSMLRLVGLQDCGEVRWTLSREKAQQIRTRYLDLDFSQNYVMGLDLSGGEGQGLDRRQLEDIVGRIIERGARALLFFSLAERTQVDYLKKTFGNRVLLFEQQDLAAVAALLEGCRALISCNTDLLHLAVSLHVPVVGVFAEDPQRWISPNNQLVKVVQVQQLQAVSITQVVQALEQALREERKTSRS